MALLDDVSNSLCQIADAAELIRNVHPDEVPSSKLTWKLKEGPYVEDSGLIWGSSPLEECRGSGNSMVYT